MAIDKTRNEPALSIMGRALNPGLQLVAGSRVSKWRNRLPFGLYRTEGRRPMKQYFVEYSGRGSSPLFGAEPERSDRPDGGCTAGGGGSTRTNRTFHSGVSLIGGGGGLAGSGGNAGSTGTTGNWSNAGGAGYVSGCGAGCCGGTTGCSVIVTSVGTGSGARAVVALPLPAAREALGAPPSPSLHGLDTSLDGSSQHGLPEPHDAYQGGT